MSLESRISAVERELTQIKAQLVSKSTPMIGGEEAIATEFAALSQVWNRETLIQSNPDVILTHPAYYRIIGLGAPVLPCIFRDLKAGGGFWFVALEAISGVNPVPAEHNRNVRLMREDWLQWGRSRGIVND